MSSRRAAMLFPAKKPGASERSGPGAYDGAHEHVAAAVMSRVELPIVPRREPRRACRSWPARSWLFGPALTGSVATLFQTADDRAHYSNQLRSNRDHRHLAADHQSAGRPCGRFQAAGRRHFRRAPCCLFQARRFRRPAQAVDGVCTCIEVVLKRGLAGRNAFVVGRRSLPCVDVRAQSVLKSVEHRALLA
jgi:hypothetical protein